MHEIEIIGGGTSWRWKCSCGNSSSGRWYGSFEEALKKAEKHKGKAEK